MSTKEQAIIEEILKRKRRRGVKHSTFLTKDGNVLSFSEMSYSDKLYLLTRSSLISVGAFIIKAIEKLDSPKKTKTDKE